MPMCDIKNTFSFSHNWHAAIHETPLSGQPELNLCILRMQVTCLTTINMLTVFCQQTGSYVLRQDKIRFKSWLQKPHAEIRRVSLDRRMILKMFSRNSL